jgi:hypothetical protein
MCGPIRRAFTYTPLVLFTISAFNDNPLSSYLAKIIQIHCSLNLYVGEISIRHMSSLEQFLGHRKDIENVEPKPIYFERFILRLDKALDG